MWKALQTFSGSEHPFAPFHQGHMLESGYDVRFQAESSAGGDDCGAA